MLRRIFVPPPSSAPAEPWTLRGQNPGRLENFSDCTFSFALTLLIISLEIPKSYDELLALLPGFFSFLACFVILSTLWHRHVQYFRRYGLHDSSTVALNTALLALVLFFLYPLKFLMNSLGEVLRYAFLHRIMGIAAARPPAFSSVTYMPRIVAVYLVGFGAVALTYALMYRHALRRRDELKLSAFEESATVDDCVLWAVATLCALTGAAWCHWAPAEIASFGSFVLFVIPLTRRIQKRRRARLARALSTGGPPRSAA